MNWHGRSGMTLMELLVALVLVAVIATGLASSTSLGIQVLDRTRNLEETSAEIALRLRLRHWLRTATSPATVTDHGTGIVGDATGIQFTTLAPAPFAPQSAALRMTVNISAQAIILRIEELDDDGGVIATHDRTLATGISGAEISYYSNEPDAVGWRDHWDNPNRLPLLIRIIADEGSTPAWPEFTVRLVFAESG
ncbi:prepilin-type N-terminal cleavage/methylation domain-containing protein [Loktanella sp. Alg231-35]|uniref:prepilin-type N-terminal cleavage/methylation domain-containing protein n=1 Tax=Loktanella sp. Alg231-35 TaxID=1922220 RepID=UPI000D55B10A|nr:prepilin-type N-terminal cleavage/methylation domain-containing protein [Loktanella sp. Alg231-35]